MVSIGKRSCALALALVLSLSLVLPARAADAKVSQVLSDTANLVLTAASDPQVGPIGGEWAVIGLARSGAACPATWYRAYYAVAETYTAACRGILHEKKYTEYARLILALSALGQDARDLAGYDLTKPLGDFNATVQQGTNGPIWALLALDSRNYPVPDAPKGKTQATRQKYVDRILATQLSDGGWSPSGGAADADLTAMALQALAGYREQGAVARALDRGIACLSLLQTESGALTAWGNATSESTAQGLLALCALGLSPNDPRLVKNGHTLLDGLLTFYRPGQGFSHTDSAVSPMATEQALLALAALRRAEAGQSSLYRMTDAPSLIAAAGQGLSGKHADVTVSPVTCPGMTFDDIAGHPNQSAVEALAARGIITGTGSGAFEPKGTLTRSQFAAIVVRGLGLPQGLSSPFTDVPAGSWFAPYVGAAYAYGIVNGRSPTVFDPNGVITRQEAAVMVARAAKLCGLDTQLDNAAVRDILSQFADYTSVGSWARPGLAFCYRQGILADSALTIGPNVPTLRCEIAQMLYDLLGCANLL